MGYFGAKICLLHCTSMIHVSLFFMQSQNDRRGTFRNVSWRWVDLLLTLCSATCNVAFDNLHWRSHYGSTRECCFCCCSNFTHSRWPEFYADVFCMLIERKTRREVVCSVSNLIFYALISAIVSNHPWNTWNIVFKLDLVVSFDLKFYDTFVVRWLRVFQLYLCKKKKPVVMPLSSTSCSVQHWL